MEDLSAGIRDRVNAISSRIVRYRELLPCFNAFIDTRTPGSSAKENFTIIGPGVSENPAQYIHIAEPHGFNIGGARQPPACMNSQHSHETAEVFVVHSGQWRFDFGETGTDASVEAGPGDLVSFPIRIFRGFTNIGTETAFLWSVLGGDDPGRVTWAPRVFELARNYGLMLLENGALVDLAAGERPPPGVAAMPPTSGAQVAAMNRMTAEDALGTVVRIDQQDTHGGGPGLHEGIVETPLIGTVSPGEGLGAGSITRPHGFQVRRLAVTAGAATPLHRRDEAEVIFVHVGELAVTVDSGRAVLGPGDTITVPVGSARAFAAVSAVTAFVVRGGDHPGPARPTVKTAKPVAERQC